MLLAMLVAALPAAGQPTSQAAPRITPTRDVDISYRIGGGPNGTDLRQRLRWQVAAHLLRVDPPVPDLFMLVDTQSRILSVVRPAQRAVLRIRAANGGLPGTMPPGTGFTRIDDDQVAGLACTDWQTRDAAGNQAIVCLTEDGVLLRASTPAIAGKPGNQLLQAVEVTYGAPDPGAFVIPPDYVVTEQDHP